MLFDPDRHAQLTDEPWDAARALRSIELIAHATENAFDPERFWPGHPLDDAGEWKTPQKNLYWGAAGNAWALWHLQQQGLVQLRIEPEQIIERIHEAYLAEPDTGEVVPSYFLGEVGILLVRWRLAGSMPGSARCLERLAAAIKNNRANPVNERLWGAPGTMMGAWHMLQWTGEPLWQELFVADAEALLERWRPSPHAACKLWTQDLYGSIVQLLGAGHGFAGNVGPLLRGASLLAPEVRERLWDDCVQALNATALRQDGTVHMVNWPPGVGPPRPGRAAVLMQWCHGAPGIITDLVDFPRGRSPELEALLVAAGEATWAAGPLAKGHGVCHGTAGNGYAFLALHTRTGEAIWLERARRFATHAIGQWENSLVTYGHGRHSLWTGDPGLAVYLSHCINGVGGLPGLDGLD
jgi:hypothetical protein